MLSITIYSTFKQINEVFVGISALAQNRNYLPKTPVAVRLSVRRRLVDVERLFSDLGSALVIQGVFD